VAKHTPGAHTWIANTLSGRAYRYCISCYLRETKGEVTEERERLLGLLRRYLAVQNTWPGWG